MLFDALAVAGAMSATGNRAARATTKRERWGFLTNSSLGHPVEERYTPT